MSYAVIELTVRNHPGVMSRVTGIVARRFFNLEGVLYGPVGEEPVIRMYLLIYDDGRLGQVIRRLETSYDIQEVCIRYDLDRGIFERINELHLHDDLKDSLVPVGSLVPGCS